MLNENVEKELNNLIEYISNTPQYKNCILIKEQMKKNENINKLIKKIKRLQKLFVRENSENIKMDLEDAEEKLNSIPIYNEYINNLKEVNEMIAFINDELNDYFSKKINN